MQLEFIAISSGPFLLLLAVIGIWYWRGKSQNRRAPLKDKLLRAPGEHLMETQSGIEFKQYLAIFAVMSGPAYCLAFAAISNPAGKPNYTLATVSYAIICLPALCYLWKLLTDASNYHLGLMGERVVGEELNKLMLHGCHVYHDFKKDVGGNIDHVVVAPSGVYCVETKCRRKLKGLPGRKDHEIEFDGERLHFPFGTDSYGVNQTRRNSRELASWLSSAVGEKVSVKGILTFPGWYITTRKMASNLRVLNPKQIKGAIASDKEKVLDAKLTKQIVHQLEQRCRDIEM